MRLISIILGTTIFVLMALAVIYFWGLGQVHPKYDHAFFKQSPPWIVVPRSFTEEISTHAEDIIWVEVYQDSHKTLVVDKVDSQMNLAEVLTALKGRRIILNIDSNTEDLDRQLAEFLPVYLDSTPILLQSDFDVVLRATKESLANLPFGSSQSDRLRLNAFAGMAPWSGGLLPATPFRGDVFITPLKWRAVPLINEVVAQEVHRRQKYLILGPLINQDELQQAQSLGADGYFTKEMSLLGSLHSLTVAH